MALAKITTKGQVTIPKNIRESLHLHTGDKIEIFLNDQGEAIIRPISKKVDDMFGILNNPKQKAVSIEDMNEGIKDRMRKKHL